MDSLPVSSTEEIISFLRRLRRYRASLPEPAQFLLDSLVTTGLGRTPDHPHPDGTRVLWSAYDGDPSGGDALHWETTPWGLEYQGRFWG